MAKTPGKGKPPVDDDVLYLDADGGESNESLDEILKQAQESADRLAQKQRETRAQAEAAAPATGPVTPDPEEIIMEEIVEEEGPRQGGAPAAAAAPSKTALGRRVAELEDESAKLKAELEEYKDGLRRKQADFENFRKRMQRDKEDFQKYAHADLLKELLPVLDNFERAMMVDSQADAESLRTGIELILRQLRDALGRFGLKEIVAIGEEFDPNLHEAVASGPSADLAPNTVMAELQKGYTHHDRLLRAACVKVATAPTGE